MVERCPRCDLRFERIEGHWTGALGVNTIVSFGLLAVTVVVGLILSAPEFEVLPLFVVAALEAILMPLFFFPFSKTIWTAIDLWMRPLVPGEAAASHTDPAARRRTLGGPSGGVAQLAERYVRNVEVGGSNPLTSTSKPPGQRSWSSLVLEAGEGTHVLPLLIVPKPAACGCEGRRDVHVVAWSGCRRYACCRRVKVVRSTA